MVPGRLNIYTFGGDKSMNGTLIIVNEQLSWLGECILTYKSYILHLKKMSLMVRNFKF